jgi:hypothetical protein
MYAHETTTGTKIMKTRNGGAMPTVGVFCVQETDYSDFLTVLL